MRVLIDANTPPPTFGNGVAYWERSVDPCHPDSFRSAMIAQGMNPGFPANGEPQAKGWMAIEWSENPVGFVADGTEMEIEHIMPAVIHTKGMIAADRATAEAKPVDLDSARWYQRHRIKLTEYPFSLAELMRVAQLPEVEYLIMHKADFPEALCMYRTAQYPLEVGDASLYAKPVFFAPDPDMPRVANKRDPLQPYTFIAGSIRVGLWPNNIGCFA